MRRRVGNVGQACRWCACDVGGDIGWTQSGAWKCSFNCPPICRIHHLHHWPKQTRCAELWRAIWLRQHEFTWANRTPLIAVWMLFVSWSLCKTCIKSIHYIHSLQILLGKLWNPATGRLHSSLSEAVMTISKLALELIVGQCCKEQDCLVATYNGSCVVYIWDNSSHARKWYLQSRAENAR